MNNSHNIKRYRKIVANTKADVSLASISQWKIGGTADILMRPSSINELVDLKKALSETQTKYLVIGATSNLLFDDDGLRVPCIQIGKDLAQVTISGGYIRAQAGAWVPGVARMAMKSGLTGGEHICGIPGTLGGLVYMNGGSQRKGIGDNVISVTTVDEFGNLIKRSQADCEFGYRKSIFQQLNETIVEVELLFERSESLTQIRRNMLDILKSRRLKFPRKEPNCGSVFKSNPSMYDKVGPPGQVIEQLGLKGYRYKSVMVSERHANFITHDGNGKASDIRELIQLVHSKVLNETGFSMDVEVHFLDVHGSLIQAIR